MMKRSTLIVTIVLIILVTLAGAQLVHFASGSPGHTFAGRDIPPSPPDSPASIYGACAPLPLEGKT